MCLCGTPWNRGSLLTYTFVRLNICFFFKIHFDLHHDVQTRKAVTYKKSKTKFELENFKKFCFWRSCILRLLNALSNFLLLSTYPKTSIHPHIQHNTCQASPVFWPAFGSVRTQKLVNLPFFVHFQFFLLFNLLKFFVFFWPKRNI